IAAEPKLERSCLDPRIEFSCRIERRTRRPVGDELDCPEQTASPDVADMAVIAEAFGEPPLQPRAARLHPVEQIFLGYDLLHFQRGGAGHGMTEIGVAMLERSGIVPDGIDDACARQHRTDRLVTAAKT